MKKKLSINDIAAQLKISKTTVSFILNGRAKEKRISDELVQKVLKQVEKVGYKPSSLAKSLRTGKSKTIGLMVEDISNPFFAGIARLIEDRAYKNGYKILYCSVDSNVEKTRELISTFRDRHVDGYIIAAPEGIEPELNELMSEGLPVVLFDRLLEGVDTDTVVIDNMESIYGITKKLIESGRKRIAFFTFNDPQSSLRGRKDGYLKALKEKKLPENVLLFTNRVTTQIFEEAKAFLEKNPKTDALIFATNQIGTSTLRAIRQLGLKIPEDLAVISFDDSEIFETYTPSITAFLQPVDEIADSVITILLKKLDTSIPAEEERVHVVLSAKLQLRQSFTY